MSIEVDNLITADTAGNGRQVAIEGRGWSNGAFTKALLEGLPERGLSPDVR